MLDDAYDRDNAFSVVEPSRLANGVIVVGPKSEIDGIRELPAQAQDPPAPAHLHHRRPRKSRTSTEVWPQARCGSRTT